MVRALPAAVDVADAAVGVDHAVDVGAVVALDLRVRRAHRVMQDLKVLWVHKDQ